MGHRKRKKLGQRRNIAAEEAHNAMARMMTRTPTPKATTKKRWLFAEDGTVKRVIGGNENPAV